MPWAGPHVTPLRLPLPIETNRRSCGARACAAAHTTRHGATALDSFTTPPMHSPALQELRGAGLRCGAYHADMEPAQRERVHSQWSAGKLQVITATIAFGMGEFRVGWVCTPSGAGASCRSPQQRLQFGMGCGMGWFRQLLNH